MALGKSVVLRHAAEPVRFVRRKISGAATIYEGAAVSSGANGYIHGIAANEDFRGFADEEVDNSGGSNGDRDALIRGEGETLLTVTGVDGIDDEGKTVYASDDNTFSLTDGGTDVPIGKVSRHVAGTQCFVAYQAVEFRSL